MERIQERDLGSVVGFVATLGPDGVNPRLTRRTSNNVTELISLVLVQFLLGLPNLYRMLILVKPFRSNKWTDTTISWLGWIQPHTISFPVLFTFWDYFLRLISSNACRKWSCYYFTISWTIVKLLAICGLWSCSLLITFDCSRCEHQRWSYCFSWLCINTINLLACQRSSKLFIRILTHYTAPW